MILFACGPLPAQKLADRPRATVTIVPGGMQRNVAGRWTTLAANGRNATDQDQTEIVNVWLDNDASRQYAREFWIPARSTRQSWFAARMPSVDPVTQPQVNLSMAHIKQSASGESFHADFSGLPVTHRSLLVSNEISRAVLMVDQAKSLDGVQPNAQRIVDAVYICRDAVNTASQDLGIVRYTKNRLPPQSTSLDAVDQMIVATDRILHDMTSARRIRQWVRSGGRLWLMLDQLDTDSVGELLGDAMCYSEVDRLALTEFSLKSASAAGAEYTATSSDWQSDQSVQMKRVIVDDAKVACTINQWPAAFVQSFGEGEILYTTINAWGLTRGQRPLEVFDSTTGDFFAPRLAIADRVSELEPLIQSEIGYRVPSRWLVAVLLGSHLLVVIVSAIALHARKQLHLLAVVIPIAAILPAIYLFWVGRQNAGATPSTVASGQFAQVTENGMEIELHSTSAIYRQNEGQLVARAASDTSMYLHSGQSQQEVRRLVWNDDGTSHWDKLKLPPGAVRRVQHKSIASLQQPWTFDGQFTEQGFEGKLSGISIADCEDPVVVSSTRPTLALTPSTADSVMVGSEKSVLQADRYYSNSLLSDRQQDRQRLLRKYASDDATSWGTRPRLLLWTKPIEGAIEFDDALLRRGVALVSMPIRFKQSKPNADFVVPASFMDLQLRESKAGFSSLYNPQTGKWLENMTTANSADLNFALPPSVVPCDLSRAIITAKVHAPGRTLKLTTTVKGDDVLLFEQDDPTGDVRIEVNDASKLQVDSDGGIRVLVSVSEPRKASRATSQPGGDKRDFGNQAVSSTGQPQQAAKWQIDYLQMSVSGTTR